MLQTCGLKRNIHLLFVIGRVKKVYIYIYICNLKDLNK